MNTHHVNVRKIEAGGVRLQVYNMGFFSGKGRVGPGVTSDRVTHTYCVPQTVCNMRLDTLEEWYQEANVSTILLTNRKP